MQRNSIARSIRVTHRYLGLFFAPAIIFFSFSGALQTLGLHESVQSGYTPARWIIAIAQLHKKQTLSIPPKIRTPAHDPAGVQSEPQKKKAPVTKRVLQAFVVLMSIALMATTLLGILMAFMYGRDRRLTMLALIAGTLFPVFVMLL